MLSVRIHGRGGQGVVTAAELLSLAAFTEGLWAQAFPSFGSERMGAPVTSFCRIDDREIRTREPIVAPDAVIVQDATLLHHVDLFSGLANDGYVLINSTRAFTDLGLGEWARDFQEARLSSVPATEITRQQRAGRPNTAMLGALSAMVGIPSQEALVRAIRTRFDARLAQENILGVAACHRWITDAVGRSVHA